MYIVTYEQKRNIRRNSRKVESKELQQESRVISLSSDHSQVRIGSEPEPIALYPTVLTAVCVWVLILLGELVQA